MLLTAPEEDFKPNTARAMKQLEGRVGIHRVEEESVEELISKIDAISEEGLSGLHRWDPWA